MTLRVGIAGCGLVGHKRAAALGDDALVGCFDVDAGAAEALATANGAAACATLDALLELEPDAVIVATTHDGLAPLAVRALEAGVSVLVEKPAGTCAADVDRIARAAENSGRHVAVGFNHRFHPGIARALDEAISGAHGPILHVRARYGHGGRLGYENEWRARRDVSGGGELVDQGMHLFDLSFALLGPMPLHSALLRTSFWPIDVEDNAVVVLGAAAAGPWSLFHVSWTEWKNLFSLEVFCRDAKLQVEGLGGSYGPERLTVYRMGPELGPPAIETIDAPAADTSWEAEWRAFAAACDAPHSVGLDSARYGWDCVEEAYERAAVTHA